MVDCSDFYFNRIYLYLADKLLRSPQHFSTNRKSENIYELIDWNFRLWKPENCFATLRNMSMPYFEGELDFYISGSPFLADIEKYSKFWKGVSDDDRSINSNYGKLLMYDRNVNNWTQFEYAKNALIRNEDTKKAVMVVYSPDNSRVSNDNPCTMYLQFFVREGSLDLYVKMRSSDVWFGLPYDVPFFVYLLFKMHKELKEFYPDLLIGSYNHQSGSLHLYDRNRSQLEECVVSNCKDVEEDQYNMFMKYIGARL